MHGISTSDWVPVAHLLRPQGRRGELLAEPLTDLPEIFSTSREFLLASPGGQSPAPGDSRIQVQEHWFPTGNNAGRVVLKLSGCDSISDAEGLSGMHLLIARHQLPTLDADTFFVGDLVGCTVFDSNSPIGIVSAVEFPTGPDGRTRLEDAAPLLAIDSPRLPQDDATEPEPLLIPFVRAWLDSVDIPARRIDMRLPSGLVDGNEDLDPA